MADTHFYAEEGLASGGDDGSTPADAFRTVKQLVEYNAFNAANVNKGWIRRSLTSTMAAIWNAADDGTAALPIQLISWPRPAIPNTTIIEGDWTNGSTQVDNVVGITLAKGEHCGRYVTAPDGFQYMITRVGFNAAGGAVADMLLLDTEYAGITVTGTDGKFQIEADKFHADRPVAGITAGWDGDNIDLSIIDGNGGNFYINFNADIWYEVHGLDLKDSAATNGIVQFNSAKSGVIYGCLLSTDQNAKLFDGVNTCLAIHRTIITGNGVGAGQKATDMAGMLLEMKDVAIYGMGDEGLRMQTGAIGKWNNVNIGVEIANGDDDITIGFVGSIKAKDLKLGGTNGYVLFNAGTPCDLVSIENYQKVLGDNKTFFSGGEYISTAVSGETPNKKLSDTVLKITPNINLTPLTKEQRVRIPLGIVNMDAGAQTVKFWLYNDLGATINTGDPELEVYLEAEYVDSYDDTTEYTKTKANSADQDIADAADADDWDSLSVAVNPAVESLVYFNLVISIYNVNDFFIDPQMVIT